MLKARFKAEIQPDGSVLVRDVPIFGVCSKQGIDFDESWIDEAVQYHRDGEQNGSLWPVHIQHHGDAVPVQSAGAWTNTRRALLKTKSGALVPGVIVDLVFTDAAAWERAKRNQLLWRSPEIPMDSALRKATPRFRSLALLDRHAPANDDLPPLLFKDARAIPNGKKAAPSKGWLRVQSEAVLAFSASAGHGTSIHVLLEPNAMPKPKPKAKKESDALRFEDEEPKDDAPKSNEGGESGGDSTPKAKGWKAALEALRKEEIPVEDIPEVKAAIEEFAASLGDGGEAPDVEIPDEPEEEGPITEELGDPTKEEAPDDLSMKDESEIIALRAEVEALKRREKQRDADAAFAVAVDRAMEEFDLTSRGVTREEVVAFCDETKSRRPETVRKFAETIAAKVGRRDATFHETLEEGRGGQTVSDAVLKFQAEGPAAYEWALRTSREWRAAREGGFTALSEERYLNAMKPNAAFVRVESGAVED